MNETSSMGAGCPKPASGEKEKEEENRKPAEGDITKFLTVAFLEGGAMGVARNPASGLAFTGSTMEQHHKNCPYFAGAPLCPSGPSPPLSGSGSRVRGIVQLQQALADLTFGIGCFLPGINKLTITG